MNTPLSPFGERAYALLRIVSGAMFAFHGVQKTFGVLSEHPVTDLQMRIGGIIELVCGTLIALGLFTSLAAFLASGTMAVAYCQFHWKFQLGKAFLPAINEGELALLYCFLFFYMIFHGNGPWSVGANRRSR